MLCYLSMLETNEEKSKFERIYYKYRNLMFYIANGILHNQQDAEDIVSLVFSKIIDTFEKFTDVECHKTKNLIVIMVRNYSINLYNQNKRRSSVPFDSLENVPLFNGTSSFCDDSLTDDILALATIHRDILNLKYLYGYSNSEIAKMLNITEDVVRKRLQRAKASLIKTIKDK